MSGCARLTLQGAVSLTGMSIVAVYIHPSCTQLRLVSMSADASQLSIRINIHTKQHKSHRTDGPRHEEQVLSCSQGTGTSRASTVQKRSQLRMSYANIGGAFS